MIKYHVIENKCVVQLHPFEKILRSDLIHQRWRPGYLHVYTFPQRHPLQNSWVRLVLWWTVGGSDICTTISSPDIIYFCTKKCTDITVVGVEIWHIDHDLSKEPNPRHLSDLVFPVIYPTLGCDIQGFRAMGSSVQYWPRWFQDFPAIWLPVPFGANGAHLGICTLPGKIVFVCEISCFWLKWSFPKEELVLWSLYGDKLSICRNQQMNGKI